MTTFNNNIVALNLTDANGAAITFIYDKTTHTASLDYYIGRIDWDASEDFFKTLASIDVDVNLFGGDEIFTPDCKTPFYCLENIDEYGYSNGSEFLVGQETLDKGLAWVKKIHNATVYAEGKERARQEVDIPNVVNPTTVGDIVCGGFDANLEYTVYHGVHEDGDILWSTSVNSRLTEDDIISSYVVTYLTIDKETKRLIIETL